ncbi:hypothetical protein C4D60_Mb06t34010 [Musa balbisiana]|uniref:Uncharacterized protein n=1 Tax=Musa balbisiana TaxID=52838 RepID=A0A4S8ITG5_MUSBA|nr:hypothetical protein C4D60_Mb06t34010 [Musa balbisiana]
MSDRTLIDSWGFLDIRPRLLTRCGSARSTRIRLVAIPLRRLGFLKELFSEVGDLKRYSII